MSRPTPSQRLCQRIERQFRADLNMRLRNVRLYPAKGFWKTKRADVQPWTGWADVVFEADGRTGSYPIGIGSWHTMTELLRNDFTISADSYGGFELDPIPRLTQPAPSSGEVSA